MRVELILIVPLPHTHTYTYTRTHKKPQMDTRKLLQVMDMVTTWIEVMVT